MLFFAFRLRGADPTGFLYPPHEARSLKTPLHWVADCINSPQQCDWCVLMLVGNGGFDENVFPSFGDLQPTSGVEFRLLFFLAGTFGGNDFYFFGRASLDPLLSATDSRGKKRYCNLTQVVFVYSQLPTHIFQKYSDKAASIQCTQQFNNKRMKKMKIHNNQPLCGDKKW